MSEPTYLELRGALNLLWSAQKGLRMSGWEGATYHHATKAESEAYGIISDAAFSINKDIKTMLGQNKEFCQAAALRSIK